MVLACFFVFLFVFFKEKLGDVQCFRIPVRSHKFSVKEGRRVVFMESFVRYIVVESLQHSCGRGSHSSHFRGKAVSAKHVKDPQAKGRARVQPRESDPQSSSYCT